MKKLKIFDSFAGVGALHCALKRLKIPIELVGVSEIDTYATINYKAIHSPDINYIDGTTLEERREWLLERNIGWNFKKSKNTVPNMKEEMVNKLYKSSRAINNLGDISLLEPENIPDFDIFNFSFPCTNLSKAGKKDGFEDKAGNCTRSGLYKYGLEIIKKKRPNYIVVENVKGLLNKRFIEQFNIINGEIEELGYNCYYPKKAITKKKVLPVCLDSKNYGVPQERERVFIICIKKEIDTGFTFPREVELNICLEDLLDKVPDEKYIVSKEMQKKFEFDYTSADMTKINKVDRIYGCFDKNGRTSQAGSVYNKKGLAPTLTTSDGGYTQPIVIRNKRLIRLSPSEYWRLMGFTDLEFKLAKGTGCSDLQLYRQAGNSIVVNILYYILKELLVDK